jgi:hypothetical protein
MSKYSFVFMHYFHSVRPDNICICEVKLIFIIRCKLGGKLLSKQEPRGNWKCVHCEVHAILLVAL